MPQSEECCQSLGTPRRRRQSLRCPIGSWGNEPPSGVVALRVHCNFSPLEKARVNVSALLVALGIKLFYSVFGGISRSSHRIYCGLGNHSVVLASNSLRKREILGGCHQNPRFA